MSGTKVSPGIHIATLAASNGLDVEGDLASILPAAATDSFDQR
jgi:hypothetical protein